MSKKFEKLIPFKSEEWREHPFCKNIICSNTGRVGNKSRMILYKGYQNEDGYLRICLSSSGHSKIHSAHRLVMESFVGLSRLDVNHINGNKQDNRLENLEYVSRLENIRHAIKTGLRKNRSVNVHNSSFDEFKVLTVATLHNTGFGQELIAEMINVSRGAIRAIITGFTYSEFSDLFNKLPKDTHGKYTARAIKEGKWIINNEPNEAV